MKVWEKELFGRKLRIEYGKVAKQSLGSVVLTYNQSTILVTADAVEEPAKGADFFPLTVEFQEKFYAVGKIPGGFIKEKVNQVMRLFLLQGSLIGLLGLYFLKTFIMKYKL